MSSQEQVNYTREVLMKMNDNQLNEMITHLKNKIESGKKAGKSMKDDEVEFCYLQDEYFRRSRWNRSSDRNRRGRAEAARPRRNFNNKR